MRRRITVENRDYHYLSQDATAGSWKSEPVKTGGRLYGGALIAMALGVAGGEDEPLVAIEFAEQGMRHEIVAELLGVGRSIGECDGALSGGVEFG